MNVVSIMAHQDDEMRCLGTMLKCRARGDRLYFVTLTDGSKGFVQKPDIPREEAVRIRREERSRLASSISAEYVNLSEPDEFLYDTPEVRMKLIEAIRKTRADLIFTHYHEDYNMDHSTVSLLVRHCAMHSCLPVLRTTSPPLKHHPAIFLVPPHGAFAFSPTHFVDVTDFEEEKIRLLKFHRSQEEALKSALGSGFEKLVRSPDTHWGLQAGCKHAEAFTPMQGRGSVKPYPVLP